MTSKRKKITLPDGSEYVGEVKGGHLHGQGTLTLPDGEILKGEYKDFFGES